MLACHGKSQSVRREGAPQIVMLSRGGLPVQPLGLVLCCGFGKQTQDPTRALAALPLCVRGRPSFVAKMVEMIEGR